MSHEMMSPVRGKACGSDGSVVHYLEHTQELTLLASGLRIATTNSPDQVNRFCQGVHVILDVSVRDGTSGITLKIQGKDPVSDEYYDILVGSKVNTVSTNVYKVHPALEADANVVAKDFLPRTWRVRLEHDNDNEITYSVGAVVVK